MADGPERTVLIVDDHQVVRSGLRQLIGSEPGLTVCGEAKDATTAQQQVEQHDPDLVLLDLSLEGSLNGIELTRQLQSRHPDLQVLILSMHDEALYAERALNAGAAGYVMKRAPGEGILQAIRHVLSGRRYVSKRIAEKQSSGEAGQLNGGASTVSQLSDRELEIFQLLGRGFAPRHIAEKLFLSVKTIETHRRHIKQKLNLDSASELTRYAIQWYKDQESL